MVIKEDGKKRERKSLNKEKIMTNGRERRYKTRNKRDTDEE